MIIVKNNALLKVISYISRFDIAGITLWPFILCTDDMGEVLLNHEKIHIKQQLELLVVGFYLVYGLIYLYLRLNGKSHYAAYMMLPFEQEAYSNQFNTNYLNERKHYAWIKYFEAI